MGRFSMFTRAVAAADLPATVATDAEVAAAVAAGLVTVATNLSTHEGDTSNVHGIVNTGQVLRSTAIGPTLTQGAAAADVSASLTLNPVFAVAEIEAVLEAQAAAINVLNARLRSLTLIAT